MRAPKNSGRMASFSTLGAAEQRCQPATTSPSTIPNLAGRVRRPDHELRELHLRVPHRPPADDGANVVSTSQPLAAQAGLRMLLDGGNAVDAALAAAITLTVVEPISNGIGCDASRSSGTATASHGLNASGRSPAAWTPELLRRREVDTGRAAGTACRCRARCRRGSSSRRTSASCRSTKLFEPAIEYAANGFPVSPFVAERWEQQVPELREQPGFAEAFLPGGRSPRDGRDVPLARPAKTLEKIAATKGEAFYRRRARREDRGARDGDTAAR